MSPVVKDFENCKKIVDPDCDATLPLLSHLRRRDYYFLQLLD